MRLTMPEEILLLLLDDETGQPVGLPGPAADLALVGAALMELALAGRIDTDLDLLAVVSPETMGDPVMDHVLDSLMREAEARASRDWIAALAALAPDLRARTIARLVEGGILHRIEGCFLWVFHEQRYPKVPGHEEARATRARLRAVLLEDDIPDPRDALLIGLCQATGLVPLLLDEAELAAAEARVEQVARLEELSRSLGRATQDVYARLLRDSALQ
jgi:hypothetical protein